MNKGKLSQVFDNIILNSEYWLSDDLASARISTGIVTIQIDKPFVRIFDNGRGIDPAYENTLFEPFVTAKGKGVGRGLGLFIVSQLLDSEGCTIDVLSQRNSSQRQYIFQISLTGSLATKNVGS